MGFPGPQINSPIDPPMQRAFAFGVWMVGEIQGSVKNCQFFSGDQT